VSPLGPSAAPKGHPCGRRCREGALWLPEYDPHDLAAHKRDAETQKRRNAETQKRRNAETQKRRNSESRPSLPRSCLRPGCVGLGCRVLAEVRQRAPPGLRGRTRTPEPASHGWCNASVARAITLVAALAAVLVLASPVHAAAPNYILVSGPGLKQPILLGNWSENGVLLSAVVNAPRAKGNAVSGLVHRPRFDLAEFWGWGSRPRPTRPSEANQHGWFYPAYRAKPLVIVLTVNGERFPRLVPRSVLKILAHHHVPLRL
jgi:hypothetical protein